MASDWGKHRGSLVVIERAVSRVMLTPCYMAILGVDK